MTLRQTLKYIAYEIDIWQGKPSILQQPSPEELQAAKERLRAEAAAFFRLHKETLNDKAV